MNKPIGRGKEYKLPLTLYNFIFSKLMWHFTYAPQSAIEAAAKDLEEVYNEIPCCGHNCCCNLDNQAGEE